MIRRPPRSTPGRTLFPYTRSSDLTKEMGIMEVVSQYPETVEVFVNAGMGCLGCAAAHFENIEQGAGAHGIDIDKLIEDLNAAIEAK